MPVHTVLKEELSEMPPTAAAYEEKCLQMLDLLMGYRLVIGFWFHKLGGVPRQYRTNQKACE